MRRRIVLLAAGAALLAVVLLAVPLGVLAARGYLRDERLELQQAAASAAATARGDVPFASRPLVHDSEIALTVYDVSARRLSGPGPVSAPRLVRDALGGQQSSAVTSNSIAVTAPVSDGDRTIAVLLMSTSLDAVHQRTLKAWVVLGAMCLGAVAVTAFVANLVARRLVAPVDRLTDVAHRIGTGDLSARAEPSGVNELDTLAGTLNDSVERIDTMITRERAFSTEVSHQLRTPVSGLRLELEEALRGLPAGGDGVGAALARAIAETDRLDATITEVVTLARDLPVVRSVDAAGLLAGVERRWHARLAARSRPLRVDAGSGCRVRISEAAANQVLDVLLDNAYEHGRGAITVRVRCAADSVTVEVGDEGAVSAESHVLFGSHHDAARGIGLPFARRVAESYDARVVLLQANPTTFALIVSS
jgi:signal transduction histidine kinase